ncbi:hypothetical protein HOLDEFILI_01826 [Holdemania filiformis DSM 12042]|uniref:Uncharacterized protein n=1 Tax=Holdemania filiformis DSM 12042 TaxID=545696 RepID=B9Y7N1_9FIRM|nr:hypothetical protein HOLDEFILI_01826 [Holdemania filiformis DSM 12042]
MKEAKKERKIFFSIYNTIGVVYNVIRKHMNTCSYVTESLLRFHQPCS